MRASEVSAVLNLVSGHIRRDSHLREKIKNGSEDVYIFGTQTKAGLIEVLNDYIEDSGFRETELISLSVEVLSLNSEIYRVEVVVRDTKTEREERSYVVVSLY